MIISLGFPKCLWWQALFFELLLVVAVERTRILYLILRSPKKPFFFGGVSNNPVNIRAMHLNAKQASYEK